MDLPYDLRVLCKDASMYLTNRKILENREAELKNRLLLIQIEATKLTIKTTRKVIKESSE